jgi:acyl-CoA synthetase (AMP-forming)/AMP-acid ligase II
LVLYFDTHRENTIWFWSTVAAGGVPAILSPLSNNETTLVGELENVNNLFQGPTILTTKRLGKPFRSMASLNTVTVEVVETTVVEEATKTNPRVEDPGRSDKLATILFTSGSTGFAKGVEYTHSQLLASSKLKSSFHGMDSSKTFMSWVSKSNAHFRLIQSCPLTQRL